jgi:hypothetical protein
MNGTVSVLIDERDNVLALPNDAIKSPREAVATGVMLGLAADSVQKELAAQGFSGGNRGGFGGRNGGAAGGNGGNGGGRNGGAAGAGNGGAATTGSANGDVALQQGSGAQGGQGGGGFGAQVSDADCKKIEDVLKAHPKEKKQIDDLRAKMQALRPAGFGGGNGAAGRTRTPGDTTRRRNGFGGGNGSNGGNGGNGGGNQGANGGNGGGGFRGSPEMQALNEQLRAIYTTLNIDPRTAGGCARRAQGANGQQANAAGAATGARGGQRTGAQGALTPSPEMNSRPQRTRTGLVFVTDSAKTTFHPRIVQLGQGNLDFTEVTNGLKEGERVVMLGALALQAQRQAQQDRARQNASPLGNQGGPGGGAAGAPRGGGGGGRGG